MLPGLVLEFYEGKNVMEYTKRESSEETKLRLVHNPFIYDGSQISILILIVRLGKLLWV